MNQEKIIQRFMEKLLYSTDDIVYKENRLCDKCGMSLSACEFSLDIHIPEDRSKEQTVDIEMTCSKCGTICSIGAFINENQPTAVRKETIYSEVETFGFEPVDVPESSEK